jgi:predicted porin
MNKKVASLAVVAAALTVSTAALAQESGVRIYGRANLGVDRYSATGATAGSTADFKGRMRVYDAGSRLGIEGAEDLGNGLKAIFLMESGVNIDNGSNTGQSGAPNPYSGTWSSRIGHVGLQGNWGRLTFGKSNVWWYNGNMEQASVNYFASGNPTFYGLLGRGMNVNVQRVSNVIQYSAQMAGYLLQLSYAPNGESVPAGGNTNGKLLAVTAQGEWGPFGAGYDWVKNQGNSSTTGMATPASIGHKLRAGWQYQPGAMLSVIAVKSIQENGGAGGVLLSQSGALSPTTLGLLQAAGLVADAAASRVQQTTWGVNLEQPLGNTIVVAQYAKVNDMTGCVTPGACDNTGATSYMVGARLNLSKRTGVYATYAQIRNESNYNMDYVGGWMTSAATTVPALGVNVPGLPGGSVGADPKMFGVGVMHNF